MAKKESSLRFKKVKYIEKENLINIVYERLVNGQYDETDQKSHSQAAPEFYDAFKELAQHAVALCEFTQDDIKVTTVTGVSYRYSGEEDVMGATMVVKKELKFSNTPLVTNTPFKKAGPDNGSDFDEKQYLSEGCVKALWELERQARLFINGHRAQIALIAEDMQGVGVNELPRDILSDDLVVEDNEDMGNVVNFPPAANGALETHVSL